MRISDRIRQFIVQLTKNDKIGSSRHQKGCDPRSEEQLVSMMIQETIRQNLPSLDLIDREGKLMDMIASYLATKSPQSAESIIDYLVEGTVAHYQDDIDYLFTTINRHQPRKIA